MPDKRSLLSDVEEDIGAFMDRRRREVEAAAGDAENVAHRAYRAAIRSGRDLGLKTAQDVRQFGKRIAGGGTPRPVRQSAVSRRSPPGSVVDGLRQGARQVATRLAKDPSVREVAGSAALIAGRPIGAVRGAVHSVEDIANAATWAAGLLTPEGWQELGEAARSVGRYVHDGVADPRKVGADINNGLHRFTQTVDPRATPQAPTLRDEMRRNFSIGMNQGELGFDVASLPYGGAELKGVRSLGRVSKAEHIANDIARGVPPKLATYLAEPYEGLGHHIIGRKTRLPKMLGGGALPNFIMENPLNKVSGRGMTRGEFARDHYGVDSFVHGGRVAKRAGTRGWSGKALGFERYGPVERAWAGTSPVTKGGVALGLGGAGTMDEISDGDFER